MILLRSYLILILSLQSSSDDELIAAVEGVPIPGANGNKGTTGEDAEEEEEWDCQFTDLAVITNPPNQPDGDPVKVNEYVFEKHLGAGK